MTQQGSHTDPTGLNNKLSAGLKATDQHGAHPGERKARLPAQ